MHVPENQSPRGSRYPAILGLLLLVGVAAGLLVWKLATTPRDESSGSGSKGVPSEDRGMTLGKELYGLHCAQCHGDKGNGDGPAARFLYPKPRNFSESKFRLVSTVNRHPTDDDLFTVITYGMPGSAMIPFGHLSEDQRKILVTYVRHLQRTGVEARLRKAEEESDGSKLSEEDIQDSIHKAVTPGEAFSVPSEYPPGPESIARGKEIYTKACAACHGNTGKGDGVQDQRNDDGSPTRPRDFTRGIFKGGRGARQVAARIGLGMPGSPMPSFTVSAAETADLTNFILSLSDEKGQSKVEHKRTRLIARRTDTSIEGEIPEMEWKNTPATPMVVSPLWWRDYPEPDLQIQALHDGKTLALRMSWLDESKNDRVYRPEDFEDMAAVQLFKGKVEPFLGMGTGGRVDLWLWRAGRRSAPDDKNHQMDDYPFESALYRDLLKGKEGKPPDFLTARAAGNQQVPGEGNDGATALTAGGFGTTTFLPKVSQKVHAEAEWNARRWTVILKRPLSLGKEEGLSLEADDRCSIAFALWEGSAGDRNGQKLVSIWHDLQLEK